MHPVRARIVSLSFALVGGGLAVVPSIAALREPAEPAQRSTIPKEVDFNRDVRPLLSNHCYKCHGPDVNPAAGFRLDTFDHATNDRGGYFAIRPGKPEESLLLKKISSKDEDVRMPPKDSGLKPLTEAEVEIIRRWIADGAKYSKHWALVAPAPPKIPVASDPKWVRNPIDAYVLMKLDEEGLKPAPEADKRTLIRRVTLTLTGLPPTLEEIQAFLADDKPGAYERVVDRLLASPHYGEHQARYWLDAVRYGDTHGLHLDNERLVYPYRDWVVRALNEDLPYNKFAEWQIAGDLLPNPTTDQKIATGYVRMNPTTAEGGAIEEEFLVKNTFDRVDTTGTVFLGLTVGCAKCHDHKFDPISQKDYYRLFAYFNSTKDKPLDGNELTPAPVAPAPTPEQDHQLQEWRKAMLVMEQKVNVEAATSWAASLKFAVPTLGAWEVAGPFPAKDFDTAFASVSAMEPGGTGEAKPWRAVKIENGKPVQAVVGADNASAYVRTTLESVAARKVNLRLGSDDGIKVWLNGKLVHQNKVLRAVAADQDSVAVELQPGKNELLIKIVNAGGGDGVAFSVGDPLSERATKALAALSASPKSPEAVLALQSLYLEAGPTVEDSAAYRKLLAEKKALEATIPMSLVAEEMPMPRPTFVLKRGQYDQPTVRVERSIPMALGSMPPGAPNNRLGLAKWIISPSNPLTARVFVNRLWQQHFGTGLVKSAEDFGNQGEWPSNKQLLDWLAVKFIKDGWSIKAMNRLIVTSSAFRQVSSVTAEKLRKDPENRFVSRGPRFRLDAEVLRDQSLYVSGLLQNQIGGKGFKPYQPPGLWEAIAYPTSNTSKYMQDHGDTLYRRSLYLFWKRTSPPPMMLTFDAPMRDACMVRRPRTNTPMQALVSMNETAEVEAAKAMAQRVVLAKPDEGERLDYAFRLAVGRPPDAEETKVLARAASRYLQRYKKDGEAAKELLSVGQMKVKPELNKAELAAWTMVCSTLMNLDEFLTQH